MKLSICLTVALTALSVAAAPSLGLRERGSSGAATVALKAAPKVALHVPKFPLGNLALHKPSRPAPHKPLRPPTRRPQIRLPAQNKPGSGSIQNGPTQIGGIQNGPTQIGALPGPGPPKSRPAPPRPRPPPPQARPAPPRSRPAPPRPRPRPQSHSDPLSSVGNLIGDVASELVPHFDLGSLFRRNRDQ